MPRAAGRSAEAERERDRKAAEAATQRDRKSAASEASRAGSAASRKRLGAATAHQVAAMNVALERLYALLNERPAGDGNRRAKPSDL